MWRATSWGFWCSFVLVSAARTLAQSDRPGWGATPYAGAAGTGVTFRVWAPHANAVHVAGTFNGWNSTAAPLTRDVPEGDVWSTDLPGVLPGQSYKYVINNGGELWRNDPRGTIINEADNRNSVIYDSAAFAWGREPFAPAAQRDLVIYELHVGSFHDPTPGDASRGTFDSVADKLDYLRDLGINAIELLPLNEFQTLTSWGYNPSDPFNIESSYGSPDRLKSLIHACHARGIAVLIDVVHNHWGADTDLWQFDGWNSNGYGGIYFYNAANVCCTPWGGRPNYEDPQVVGYIHDSFRRWIEEFHVDGFRWDTPFDMMYYYDSVTASWQFLYPGYAVIQGALEMMQSEHPGVRNIAENIRWLSGFDSSWETSFPTTLQDVVTPADDGNRNIALLAQRLDSGVPPAQRVIFSESHDTAGDLNGGQRLPVRIDGTDPGSYWARKRSTLAAALVMTAPGVPMLLQGQEFLTTHAFSDTQPLDWSRTNSQARIVALYRDLIHLRRNLNGVSGGLAGDQYHAYHVDDTAKLLAFSRRHADAPNQDVVVVANVANTVRSAYALAFPQAGTWYVHLNTDAPKYGADYDGVGSVQVEATGIPPTGPIDIGRYSALVLSRVPPAVRIESASPADTPGGNGDEAADPDETLTETIVLRNSSASNATAVAAILTTTHAGITILQPSANYPDLPAGATATNGSPFQYAVSRYLPCGSTVAFELITTWNGAVFTDRFERVIGSLATVETVTNRYSSTDVPRAILDQQAGTEIGAGVAPFDGAYVPDGDLGLLNGRDVNGLWSLRITDAYDQDQGTLLCWDLRLLMERQSYTCEVDNQPPVAVSTGVVFAGSGPVDVELSATDADGDPLTLALVTAPAHGRVSGPGTSAWALAYTPAYGFVGTDVCAIVASDPFSSSAAAPVTFAVHAPFDQDGDGMSDAWETQHFTNAVAGEPSADDDRDGASNLAEYRAQTNPQDLRSRLRVTGIVASPTSGVTQVTWDSIGATRYRVETAGALGGFTSSTRTVAQEMDPAPPGQPASMTYTDSLTPTSAPTHFYRVRVVP